MGSSVSTYKNNGARVTEVKDSSMGVRALVLEGERTRNGNVLYVVVELDLMDRLSIYHFMTFFKQQWRLSVLEKKSMRRYKSVSSSYIDLEYIGGLMSNGSYITRADP